MIAVLMTLSLSIAAQGAPTAADLQPAFGNTLVSTYPDGRTSRLWLNADGRYEGQGRRGGRSSGVWTVADGRVCLRQRRPIPVPRSFCEPIVRGGVGASWTTRAVTGEPITVRLVAGR